MTPLCSQAACMLFASLGEEMYSVSSERSSTDDGSGETDQTDKSEAKQWAEGH